MCQHARCISSDEFSPSFYPPVKKKIRGILFARKVFSKGQRTARAGKIPQIFFAKKNPQTKISTAVASGLPRVMKLGQKGGQRGRKKRDELWKRAF